MEPNVSFATTTQDNSEYLLNENARLVKELVAVKQQAEPLATKNQ